MDWQTKRKRGTFLSATVDTCTYVEEGIFMQKENYLLIKWADYVLVGFGQAKTNSLTCIQWNTAEYFLISRFSIAILTSFQNFKHWCKSLSLEPFSSEPPRKGPFLKISRRSATQRENGGQASFQLTWEPDITSWMTSNPVAISITKSSASADETTCEEVAEPERRVAWGMKKKWQRSWLTKIDIVCAKASKSSTCSKAEIFVRQYNPVLIEMMGERYLHLSWRNRRAKKERR